MDTQVKFENLFVIKVMDFENICPNNKSTNLSGFRTNQEIKITFCFQ